MINKILKRKKLHLRLMLLSIIDDGSYFMDFVPPIDPWFEELERVQLIVTDIIDEYIQHSSKESES